MTLRRLALLGSCLTALASPALADTAIFAGGCFWSMQRPFDALEGRGVISTTVGYAGGNKENPTYEEVSSGTTGHLESVQVSFDPRKISYESLLNVYWANVDPYDSKGQFCDKGGQYRSAIFYQNPAQKKAAEDSERSLLRSGKLKEPVATLILPATRFYPAEEYHQEFYKKNPTRYGLYRAACGRDRRLEQVWGKPPG